VLENLAPDSLPRLLRRCAVSALVVGGAIFVIAVFFVPVAGAGGFLVGTGLSLLNLRLLARNLVRVEVPEGGATKMVRRRIRSNTLSRLAGLTIIVGVSLWLSFPLGVGIVSGLAVYQLVFVASVYRTVIAQGGAE
jgi:hypothetical protein